ncbi:MAG: histidine kinase dimerization/phospho-acceptor domain-containing protein [Candidatus Methanoglobus sp.]
MRLKSLKVEKEKEKALRLIMKNLENFEKLAYELRNPLAVIKGYLEIREEVPESEFIRNISEHAAKIEKILDELRIKELQTYEMKKSPRNYKMTLFALQGEAFSHKIHINRESKDSRT